MMNLFEICKNARDNKWSDEKIKEELINFENAEVFICKMCIKENMQGGEK